MTTEEIKQQTSMRDVLDMYGVQVNRHGFAHCPMPGHTGDREASFKVYEKDFHCYGCQAHGDIFNFVMLMDGCGFKEAFKKLGGGYAKPTAKSAFAAYHRKRDAERRERLKKKKHDEWLETVNYLKWKEDLLKWALEEAKPEPMSDYWCYLMNELQKVSGLLDILCGVC